MKTGNERLEQIKLIAANPDANAFCTVGTCRVKPAQARAFLAFYDRQLVRVRKRMLTRRLHDVLHAVTTLYGTEP